MKPTYIERLTGKVWPDPPASNRERFLIWWNKYQMLTLEQQLGVTP